jgi:hypothetical protein
MDYFNNDSYLLQLQNQIQAKIKNKKVANFEHLLIENTCHIHQCDFVVLMPLESEVIVPPIIKTSSYPRTHIP